MENTSPEDASVLGTIKKMLGVGSDLEAFDTDILMDINSVFLSLNQLGVGPNKPYHITGSGETWGDFCQDFDDDLYTLATYVYLKVRLLFDPPTSSFVSDAIKDQIAELEFRLNVQVDDGSGGV